MSFGEPTGQGWLQFAELGLALVLSALIGLEREIRQKSAGLRTYTLVGLASALIILISKYGFTDILADGRVVLDPSRIAAQIVSGIGFIGGGVIFVRKDLVRGLTTATTIWVTSAVGMACGAGLPLLAIAVTGANFVVIFGFQLARTTASEVEVGTDFASSVLSGRAGHFARHSHCLHATGLCRHRRAGGARRRTDPRSSRQAFGQGPGKGGRRRSRGRRRAS